MVLVCAAHCGRQPSPVAVDAGSAGLPQRNVEAPVAAVTEPPVQWLEVREDRLPFLANVKNHAKNVQIIMPIGFLVETRTETRESFAEEAKAGTLALDVSLGDGVGSVQRQGAIRAVTVSDGWLGFTFADGLRDAPQLPARSALCQRIGAEAPAVFSASTCMQSARFVRLAGAPTEAVQLAVYGDQSPEKSVLAVIQPGAPAGQLVKSTFPSAALYRLRQVALGANDTLLVINEFVRDGNRTGGQIALVVVDAAGLAKRTHAFDEITSDPQGDSVTQRTCTLSLAQSATGTSVEVVSTDRNQRPERHPGPTTRISITFHNRPQSDRPAT